MKKLELKEMIKREIRILDESIQVPKWFNGVIYKKGAKVSNPFSKETVFLDPIALSIYDMIKGAESMGKYKDMRRGLSWFRKNYPSEYMTLLD